ncbi:MAG TPA: Yip1 family protein [Burkholderiaceae bacterium]|nr:Yip1 family protein [Burkholderiaceae bacterium]
MSLIQRVQDILLKPKETWPIIAGEGGDTASIYSNYVIYLAAIPAIASFIGFSLIGAGAFGYSVRMPIVSGLVQMVVSFALYLVMVFVIALIVDALAPTFNGTKSQINALKLVAYGSTAGFVGGIFGLIPSLSILGLIAGLYSIYLIYTGLPVMMKCPPEKAGAYTAVVIVCGIVAAVILGAVMAVLMPGAGMRTGFSGVGGHDTNVTISTPGGEVKIDTAKMEEMAKKMEEASKSGDPAAAGKAAGAMIGAITGTNAAPIAAADLKALLPEAIGDLKRESVESGGGNVAGIGGSSAKAAYAAGDKRVRLSVTDLGGIGGVAAMAAWANVTSDRETPSEVEKTYKSGERTVHEKQMKDGSRAEYTVLLANGVVVEAEGDQVDIAALKSLVDGVGLAKVEALKRAAKQ